MAARAASAAADGAPQETNARAAIAAATAALCDGLVERETEAQLLMLALAAREHLLLLGPPGTAKSELCRRLAATCELSYFERTLTRFSTPEELFGPLSLAALERDELKRASKGYAPDAELLFIDEIFKASSPILNTLLTLLNERLFDEGATRVPAPLRSAVAASNEGPDADELNALYDRFLIRKVVSPLSDEGVLELLLGADGAEQGAERGARERRADGAERGCATDLFPALEAIQLAAPAVSLPRFAALLLRDARRFVSESDETPLGDGSLGGGARFYGGGGGYVSDRRLRRSADLLRVSAAAHGRQRVSVVDLLAVLPHVLWEDPEEAPALADWLERNALPDAEAESLGYLLRSLRARAIAAAADAVAGDAAPADAAGVISSPLSPPNGAPTREDDPADGDTAGRRAANAVLLLIRDAEALTSAALDASAEMRTHAAALSAADSHLFLAPEGAARLRQRLLPHADARAAELEAIATEAEALVQALKGGAEVAVLESLVEGGGEGEGGDDGGAQFTEEQASLSESHQSNSSAHFDTRFRPFCHTFPPICHTFPPILSHVPAHFDTRSRPFCHTFPPMFVTLCARHTFPPICHTFPPILPTCVAPPPLFCTRPVPTTPPDPLLIPLLTNTARVGAEGGQGAAPSRHLQGVEEDGA